MGWNDCVTAAPVSRMASLAEIDGPVAPWVISEAMMIKKSEGESEKKD
jgi:hypothetical protein